MSITTIGKRKSIKIEKMLTSGFDTPTLIKHMSAHVCIRNGDYEFKGDFEGKRSTKEARKAS